MHITIYVAYILCILISVFTLKNVVRSFQNLKTILTIKYQVMIKTVWSKEPVVLNIEPQHGRLLMVNF